MKPIESGTFGQTRTVSLLSLFAAGSTLICCALPALLVALGAGATLAALISFVPQLVWFSEHKTEVFLLATVMLALSGGMQWRARRLPCPVDPSLAAVCMQTRGTSLKLYLFSAVMYGVGGFFAFVAPLLND